ncbi:MULTISPECIES: hypothetical protein [Acidithiobacillus]|uniref:Uncharacterized protein n=3 Tax=Acidithiobacillus TaxID=119977 RepID=A0A179BNB2_ACIFR|nr:MULTISPECIES: hypothetical protein [Acidithiobacillus]MEB8475584.1 hypothetical protein [Acidithiobacillus ferriphilus]MEB8487412.1 hypothetical protein [Acidithiobacillus ferriphilus]MEB8493227.1 hypothetical protein [Acidithiobacillus ferriphilus]MEB8514883.1 hypothetical protein [Acidithiobacillus ferriphilus]MEB8520972.1 hypothetical protein [Acidithiobacillus ferriphilus]
MESATAAKTRIRRSPAERLVELEQKLAQKRAQEKMLMERIDFLKNGRKRTNNTAELAKAIPQIKRVFHGLEITMETVLGIAVYAKESIDKGEASIETFTEIGKSNWRTRSKRATG